MVAQAAIPIVTAVGEYAAPYLIREAGKVGIKKFIETYGSTAFQTIAGSVVGGMILDKAPPLDLQKEKLFGVPVSRITGQGEVYSDIDEDKKEESVPIKTTEEKLTEPTEPEPPKGPDVSDFLAETAIHTARKGTEELLKKKEEQKDISKQTKDLVTKEPEFGALTETEKQTALLEKGDKPDFYSRAIKSIEDAKPDKLTKTKWKSYIQSTKEELDYLGLTEFLKGNESITKQELLDFVKGKDLAATMTVRPVPEDQMNPMWVDYSLGFEKSGTQEHIVFQIGFDPAEDDRPVQYREPHFVDYSPEYADDTFAHARVQVGFGDSDAPPADYEHLDSKVFDKFDNTLIIDEIQSQWIQTGQDKGFVSDFSFEDRGDSFVAIKDGEIVRRFDSFDEPPSIKAVKDMMVRGGHAVPDLPLKDSKKFVELVLNEMIRKAVKDGRDSVAITNGQIQYNRYEAMGEKERQGLKKFYDTFVYDQLNKIAKNYGVELERIDIGDTEQTEIDQTETQIQFPRKVKTAQTAGYKLEKVTLQELWDRIQDTNMPGHAALYSNEGRGQGQTYIENWFNALVDNRAIAATDTTEEGLSGSGLKRWEKIKNNEVYIWKDPNVILQEHRRPGINIVWDMPIVPVKDTLTNEAVKGLLNASKEDRESVLKSFTIGGEAAYPYAGENINNTNLIQYTEYLRNYKPPEGVDLGYEQDVEQLIKMKLPKKLQKEILKKPIRLTKVKQQTDRMFG